MSDSGYPSYGYQPGYGGGAEYPQPSAPGAASGPVPGQGYAPPAATYPPTNAGWAVAAVIFFWPLAFSAFTHSSSVYPRWASGDYHGAQYASDRTKQLGKYALWIFAGLWGAFVVFYIVIIAVVISSATGYN